MDKTDLARWLCGPDAPEPPPSAVANALGLPGDALADTTLLRMAERVLALRFILAVLRDVFADDIDVRCWVRAHRDELAGARPLDLLLAGRTAPVEDLAVRAWHDAVATAITP